MLSVTTTTKIFLVFGFLLSINDAYSNSRSNKKYCNLCIDENSIVGLPEKTVTEDWTCGSMEVESKEIDANDELCDLVQEYAKDCHCHPMGGQSLSKYNNDNQYKDDSLFHFDKEKESHQEEEESDDGMIGIRTRDYDQGFRDKNTDNVNVQDFGSNTEPKETPTKQQNTTTQRKSLLSSKFPTVLSFIFLFFVMFALSVKTPAREASRNERALSTGSLMQFVVIPLSGFLMVLLLKQTDAGFTKAMGFTLLVVTSSPAGLYSNWWSSIFNVDVELSIAMTFFSTFLCLAMLPLNLAIYTNILDGMSRQVHYGTVFTMLGFIMAALLGGRIASYRIKGSKTFIKRAHQLAFLSTKGMIILFYILSSFNGTHINFWNQDGRIYVGALFINLVGIFLTNVFSQYVAKIEKPQCVTLSIECTFKNTAIAMTLALAMFDDPESKAQALAIGIIYTLTQKFTMLTYCLIAWKMGWTNAPSDRSLWIILVHSYESNTHRFRKFNDWSDNNSFADDEKPLKDVEDEIINMNGNFSADLEKEEQQPTTEKNSVLSLLDHQPPEDNEVQEYKEGGDTTTIHSVIKDKEFVQSASQWPNNFQNYASKFTIGNLFIVPNLSASQIVVNSSPSENNNNNNNPFAVAHPVPQAGYPTQQNILMSDLPFHSLPPTTLMRSPFEVTDPDEVMGEALVEEVENAPHIYGPSPPADIEKNEGGSRDPPGSLYIT